MNKSKIIEHLTGETKSNWYFNGKKLSEKQFKIYQRLVDEFKTPKVIAAKIVILK